MKRELKCDFCGKRMYKYPSQIHRHNFCSRKCLADFSSREKNPEAYNDLKDYGNISEHMKQLNAVMNQAIHLLKTTINTEVAPIVLTLVSVIGADR